MVTFDCSANHHDGVTLVTARVRDLPVPTRVTVRNCLDGPVWPPRSEGVPEAGWTTTGFSGVLGPGSHALGYATPARPEGTPAELADAVPAPDATTVGDRSDRPADVVRELGDPSPPGDAVPAATPGPSASDTTPTGATTGPQPTPDGRPTAAASDLTDADGTADARDAGASDAGRDHTAELPPELGPWLAEMERRTDTAEALAAADTVPEATAAVRQAGGLDGVRSLSAAGDERQLRRLARRARRLADRRAAATIPVERLAALA